MNNEDFRKFLQQLVQQLLIFIQERDERKEKLNNQLTWDLDARAVLTALLSSRGINNNRNDINSRDIALFAAQCATELETFRNIR